MLSVVGIALAYMLPAVIAIWFHTVKSHFLAVLASLKEV